LRIQNLLLSCSTKKRIIFINANLINKKKMEKRKLGKFVEYYNLLSNICFCIGNGIIFFLEYEKSCDLGMRISFYGIFFIGFIFIVLSSIMLYLSQSPKEKKITQYILNVYSM